MEHYSLCSICEVLNRAFAIQLLFTISKIFFTLLSTLFFWAQNILLDKWSPYIARSDMYYPYSGSLLLLHIIQLLVVVYCCSQTAEKVSFIWIDTVKNLND